MDVPFAFEEKLETIHVVKEQGLEVLQFQVFSLFGVEPDEQRLICDGKQIHTDQDLLDLDLQNTLVAVNPPTEPPSVKRPPTVENFPPPKFGKPNWDDHFEEEEPSKPPVEPEQSMEELIAQTPEPPPLQVGQSLVSRIPQLDHAALFTHATGEEIDFQESLEGKKLLLYFTALLDECLAHNNLLELAYDRLLDKGANFEVVMVPLAKDQEQYLELVTSFSWPAVPWDRPDLQAVLLSAFNVQTLPFAATVDMANCATIESVDYTPNLIQDPNLNNLHVREPAYTSLIFRDGNLNGAKKKITQYQEADASLKQTADALLTMTVVIEEMRPVLNDGAVAAVIEVLEEWDAKQKFPALDIARQLLVRPAGRALRESLSVTQAVFVACTSIESTTPTVLMGLRYLVNLTSMWLDPTGEGDVPWPLEHRQFPLLRLPQIARCVEVVNDKPDFRANKQVLRAAVGLVINGSYLAWTSDSKTVAGEVIRQGALLVSTALDCDDADLALACCALATAASILTTEQKQAVHVTVETAVSQISEARDQNKHIARQLKRLRAHSRP